MTRGERVAVVRAAGLLKNGTSKQDVHGEALHRALRDVNFEGISGFVSFDKRGDRLASYELYVAAAN